MTATIGDLLAQQIESLVGEHDAYRNKPRGAPSRSSTRDFIVTC